MTPKSPRSSDPARQVRALWRLPTERPGRRGPRPSLDLDDLVTTAVRLADAEGLKAVSVRRLTAELGLSRMAVYTYVSGHGDLVELMVDAVHGELGAPDVPVPNDEEESGEGTGWRDRVRALADRNLALLRRHPWLVDVPLDRPPLGPGTIGKYERELRALSGLGLSDEELDLVLTHVLNFVRGIAVDLVASERLEAATAQTDAEWWRARQAVLTDVITSERYPTATRVGAAAGAATDTAYDPQRAYEFGLDLVLDGITRLVGR